MANKDRTALGICLTLAGVLLGLLIVVASGCTVKGDWVLIKMEAPKGEEATLLETKENDMAERQENNNRERGGWLVGDSSCFGTDRQ